MRLEDTGYDLGCIYLDEASLSEGVSEVLHDASLHAEYRLVSCCTQIEDTVVQFHVSANGSHTL